MFWLRFKIGTRIAVGLGLVLLLSAATTGVGVWHLNTVADRTQVMMADPLIKERLAQEWFRNITAGVRRTIAIAKSTDMTLDGVFAEEIKVTTARTNAVVEELAKRADAREKQMLEKAAELSKVFLDARKKVIEAKKEGKQDEADRLFAGEFMTAANTYLASVQAFLDEQMKTIDGAGDKARADAGGGRSVLIAVGALTLGFGAFLGFVLSRSITRPLHNAVEVARAVATGDLRQRIDAQGQDETAQLLRALGDMQQRLSELVQQVRQGVDSVGVASEEIARGNADLSRRTEQTSSHLQETAGSMTQLTGTVSQTADAARTANQLAASASAVAQRGGEVVSQVIATMGEINSSSKRIADIIGTIDGIAFQTNILALNAAVEAARAGEQGRGFAVVAGEVRSLAGRSAEAAREIKSLIGASVEKVDSGSRLVQDAGSTMTEIVTSVQRVTDTIAEISSAATEQSSGIGRVSGTVTQLDQMTQQNAALVEQSAAAAESLKSEAQRLTGVVATFRLQGA